MAETPDDVWLPARERGGDRESAMRAYLAWEIDLVNQMATGRRPTIQGGEGLSRTDDQGVMDPMEWSEKSHDQHSWHLAPCARRSIRRER